MNIKELEYLEGQVFGDFKIIKILDRRSSKDRHKLCKVKCLICNREKIITLNRVLSLNGVSHKYCIYLVKCDKRFARIFHSMKSRCNNPNFPKYQIYGARGIKCNYNYLIDFYDDMYESYIRHVLEYGEKNTTLDRKDVNGDYKKSNLRWATIEEQARNRRDNRAIKIIDMYANNVYYFQTISESANYLNINRSVIDNAICRITPFYNRFYAEYLYNDFDFNDNRMVVKKQVISFDI